jgi:hypothetical protein
MGMMIPMVMMRMIVTVTMVVAMIATMAMRVRMIVIVIVRMRRSVGMRVDMPMVVIAPCARLSQDGFGAGGRICHRDGVAVAASAGPAHQAASSSS